MLDLEKLRTFVTVVSAGSFVRAAEELNLSQPAVSRNIQILERQFGVRLLDRDRTGVRVTPVGNQILKQAINLLSNALSIEKTLSAASHGLTGTVRFGIGPFTATALLPQVLARYASSELHLKVEVSIGSTSAMRQQLLDDQIEFFIGVQDAIADDPAFSCQALAEIIPRFFVRPGHPLVGMTPGLAEIEAYPIASGTDLGGVLDLAERAALGHPSTFLVNNIHVLGEVCLSTDSVLVAGDGAIPEELVEVTLASGPGVSRSTLGIVSIRSRSESPAAAQLRSDLIRVAGTIHR
ncbi:LysR family transcriptional regulator [Glaciibacter sp. 2TAF33]|uniref:LysR family transcriptional regulator n=1 Tax=Glaciibacter sp. 2TAF33 TaxID=3233015 RepID=UPI003F932E77